MLKINFKHKRRNSFEDTTLKTKNKFKKNNIKTIMCHYCGGIGKACWKFKNDKYQLTKVDKNEENNLCFVLNEEKNMWVDD